MWSEIGFGLKLTGSVNDERVQVGHTTKSGGLFEREKEFADGVAIAASGTVDFGGASGGDGLEERFALKGGAAFAVGPAVLEDKVQPFFDEGWGAVPEKGVLKDDDIMVEEELLFGLHIDHVVRVEFVQMADGDALDGFSGGDEMAIDARTMGHRMGVKEEDSASHDVRRGIFLSNSLNYNEQGKQQIGESGLT
jgi:hypothetical protein